MRPQAGDKVEVLGCRFSSGTLYMQEYELVEIAEDHITLKHLRNITRDGEQRGSGELSREPLEMLDYLSIPFEERCQKQVEAIQDFCENLTRKSHK